MQISYIILAYNHPKQVERLVRRLSYDDVAFYIHIDKKSDVAGFVDALVNLPHVTFIDDADRVDCRWGDYSLMKAVMVCCKKIVADGRKGYVALLSGQDYPLRSPGYISRFLDDNKGRDYLSIYSIPDPKKKSENGGEERFLNYTFDCCNPRNSRMKAKIRPLSLNLKTMVGFFRLLLFRRSILPFAICKWFQPRHYPACLAKVFNEFWFVLQMDSIKYILDFVDRHPEVVEYYKYTHIPDETMFGSILCADDKHKSALVPMCHLIDWETISNGSPKSFGIGDIDFINNQCCKYPHLLFARKFDENDAVLDLLDTKYGNN